METKKVYLNLWVPPAIKQALVQEAERARPQASLSNLSSSLLEWAIGCMERAGGFHQLLESYEVVPKAGARIDRQAEVENDVFRRRFPARKKNTS